MGRGRAQIEIQGVRLKNMDHAPFILASYGAAAVILLWCALAPVVRAQRFRARLNAETSHDADA